MVGDLVEFELIHVFFLYILEIYHKSVCCFGNLIGGIYLFDWIVLLCILIRSFFLHISIMLIIGDNI